MAILPKAIYMFNTIPIKIPMTFITESEKSTLKFIWKHKRPILAKAILAKRTMPEVSQDLTSNYTQSHTIKTAWHKNKYEDQWKVIEGQDMNPCNCAHLIFNKAAKNIQWRIDSPFNKCCWEKW
jgi:hypothetical protein